MSILAGTVPERVAEIIIRYSMLPATGRVGVAVSGGADSVALLHILRGLRSDLTVLHVNHHLRGEESDGDEAFVRELAQSLGVAVLVEHATPAPGNLEGEARHARRAFFLRSREEFGLVRIALGHTRSDQAETVLFRLLRGSGLTGLAGMRPITEDGFIRPLLAIGREEVRSWAREQGLTWREDSSNADLRFSRNRLRHETLPELARTYNPNLVGVLAGLANLAQTEESYWNEQVESIYPKITKRNQLGSFFQIDQLNALHPALGRRILRRAIHAVRGGLAGIDLAHVEVILNLCTSREGHDRVLIPGVDALRSFDELLLAQPGVLSDRPRNYRLPLEFGQKCELPFGAGALTLDYFCANFKKEQDLGGEVSDLDAGVLAGEELSVRNWLPGDVLHRAGHRTAEKIKSLFQLYRVPLWERRHWPVVVAGEEIVWARQFGGAARFGVSGENREIVRLAYHAVNRKV
ncbi:MAG TPA: tRNA lysidine(34) synthetase TilS [Bryobacteraceae bacterium]|jgi:tRNA(Ile)-lysidine synthase